jgi:hypothetical protein
VKLFEAVFDAACWGAIAYMIAYTLYRGALLVFG